MSDHAPKLPDHAGPDAMLAEPVLSPGREATRRSRRLLLLSYHFPPGTAAGALRWQKLSAIAIERGWEVEVVTLERPEAPIVTRLTGPGPIVHGVRQQRLFRERAEHLAWRVYDRLRPRRVVTAASAPAPAAGPSPAPAPARPAGGFSLVALKRAYYAWLETGRDRRWALDAATVARRILRGRPADVLVTCGPPHMVHWAGHQLASRAKIPHVMDLRDPWSLVERLADVFDSPLWYRIARRYEQPAASGADLIVMNSVPARDAMRELYPAQSDKIIHVMNGYDEDDRVPPRAPSSQFRIVFAGSLYLDRNPTALFRAAARVVREFELAPADFHIEFVGNVGSTDPSDPHSVPGAARSEGIGEYVSVSPFRPRHELAELLASATILLSLYQDSRTAIPSKIFEYMQYDAWILTFAEPNSATEVVLRDTGADILDPHDTERLVATLTRRYRQFQAGERPVRIAAQDQRYSRRTQAGILFDRLETLVPEPAAR